MTISHRWQPIADLPEDTRELTDGELVALLRVWNSQKNGLLERAALDEFDKRLRREWAIETGIIEDVYTLDRGVTRTLIEKGIDEGFITRDSTNRDPILVARIIQDHYDALEGMFDFVAGRRPLSTSYVKELHAALLRNVETYKAVDQFGQAFEKRLEKGLYKTDPNSPTRADGSKHEYCPPDHVASEMDELIRMHLDHESRGVPPEVASAWLHHRFTEIHPFADGNGRVARALASLVLIRAGWFPLVVKRDDRTRYIEALEKADGGDLRPLVSLFVEIQRSSLIGASEVFEVRPVATPHDAVLAVRDRLIQRGKLSLKEWHAAEEVATELAKVAVERLAKTAAELDKEIGALGTGFRFEAVGFNLLDRDRELAIRKSGQATSGDYSDLAYLILKAGVQSELTLAFDAIGPAYRGFIRVLPYLTMQGTEPRLIDAGIFLINYEEDLASAEARFSPWLDRVIVDGLNLWRLTL